MRHGFRLVVRRFCLAIALAGAAAAPAGAQGATVSAYPIPGMQTATTGTQISFRGAPAAELGRIVVTGSRSGRHAGRLRAHSDGRGASFVPGRPFRAGERVSVRTALRIAGVRGGDFSFGVGRRPALGNGRPTPRPWSAGRGEVQRFATRPDLVPPRVTVTTRREGRSPGMVFLAAKRGRGHDGPMIVDDFGRVVWFRPILTGEVATDFRVQRYRDKPVLTWWQGRLAGGHGVGEGVLFDDRYRLVRRVRMGNGLRADLHEFQLTPQNTALLIAYDAVLRGGRRITQPVVQELDIATGLVQFEWHGLDHIALSESYEPRPSARRGWDYMHLNSIALDASGDLIVSARATQAVYRIARNSGRVVWRLGGRRSDFRLGPGARFAYQHDARPQPDGTITIYDNGASPPVRKRSRAITLALDPRAKIATLRRALVHPAGLLSATQGSAQALAGGNTFVGWGSQRWFSEYDARGGLVFDGRLARGNDSYRAYRFPWTGRPETRPKLVASRRGSRVSARVSWNGATEVAAWQLLAGASPRDLAPVATVARGDFETALGAATPARYVAVRALDAAGRPLGSSAAQRL